MAKSQAVYIVDSELMNTWWVRASTKDICDVLNEGELFADENTWGNLPNIYLVYISLDGSTLNSTELIYINCVTFKSKEKNKINEINNLDNIIVGDFNNSDNDSDDNDYETDPSVVAGMTLVYTNEDTHVDFYVKFPMQLDGELPDDIYYCEKCGHLTAVKCHETKCNDID